MKEIIIYHDNCHDGVTAAWVAMQAYPAAELYPGKYDEPPDMGRLRGKDVLIVDFSWKRGPMQQLGEVAGRLRVFDHHKSAEAELKGLAGCVFDMQRSGAGITWDELFPCSLRPWIVDYVEDRDIWRFALPNSREVHASLASHPLDIETRDKLAHESLEDHIREGRAILRYHDQLVQQAVKYRPRATITGHNVPCVALPVISLVSDVGHVLAQGEPFAATYTLREDGSRVFSLRSTEEGKDVSEVARKFGGGGHRNAAGFTLAQGEDLE